MNLFRFWPGFLPFYYYGSAWGWCLAMFFAWLGVGVVCGTIFWTEWIPQASHRMLWFIFGALWFLGMLISYQHEISLKNTEAAHEKAAVTEDTLPLAQTAYLRREFYEAERILRERLHRFPEDIPARLLLVSVRRQQECGDDALAQLKVLEENPRLGPWLFEVRREKELLCEPK